MAEKGRLFTGARARFSINGKKVGYARNVNVTEEVRYEAAECLDNIEVEEHAPTGYYVRMAASMFKLVGSSLKEAQWFPSVGGNTEEHLENILVSGDLVATIEDTKTQKMMATVEQVRITTHNWTVDARGIVGEDVEFVAVRVKDESEV